MYARRGSLNPNKQLKLLIFKVDQLESSGLAMSGTDYKTTVIRDNVGFARAAQHSCSNRSC